MTEQQLIDDLKATFPGIHAKPLSEVGLPGYTKGVRLTGEACMPDECPIFSGSFPDNEIYNGYVHKVFEAWIEQRGYWLECYDIGVYFALPEDAFYA